MFCKTCGASFSPGTALCPACGAPTLEPPVATKPRDLVVNQQGVPVARQTEPLAIASLACGIASFLVIPVLGGLMAVILGHLARGSIRRSSGTREGSGVALAGLLLGYLNVGLVLLVLLLTMVGMGALLMGRSPFG
jgi:hypothetical protein